MTAAACAHGPVAAACSRNGPPGSCPQVLLAELFRAYGCTGGVLASHLTQRLLSALGFVAGLQADAHEFVQALLDAVAPDARAVFGVTERVGHRCLRCRHSWMDTAERRLADNTCISVPIVTEPGRVGEPRVVVPLDALLQVGGVPARVGVRLGLGLLSVPVPLTCVRAFTPTPRTRDRTTRSAHGDSPAPHVLAAPKSLQRRSPGNGLK